MTEKPKIELAEFKVTENPKKEIELAEFKVTENPKKEIEVTEIKVTENPKIEVTEIKLTENPKIEATEFKLAEFQMVAGKKLHRSGIIGDHVDCKFLQFIVIRMIFLMHCLSFFLIYSCKFIFLKSQSTEDERKKCCDDGVLCHKPWNIVTDMEPLKPYPPDIVKLLLYNIPHFSKCSAYYNRTMSIADTRLSNGGRNGGCERRQGDASVTINGSVKYILNDDAFTATGGISYFTFDGLDR